MESPTRVKIAITVDLNEVPSIVSSRMLQAAEKLRLVSEAVSKAATTDGKDLSPLGGIESARIELMGVDLMLEDCYSIWSELATAQLQEATGEPPREE